MNEGMVVMWVRDRDQDRWHHVTRMPGTHGDRVFSVRTCDGKGLFVDTAHRDVLVGGGPVAKYSSPICDTCAAEHPDVVNEEPRVLWVRSVADATWHRVTDTGKRTVYGNTIALRACVPGKVVVDEMSKDTVRRSVPSKHGEPVCAACVDKDSGRDGMRRERDDAVGEAGELRSRLGRLVKDHASTFADLLASRRECADAVKEAGELRTRLDGFVYDTKRRARTNAHLVEENVSLAGKLRESDEARDSFEAEVTRLRDVILRAHMSTMPPVASKADDDDPFAGLFGESDVRSPYGTVTYFHGRERPYTPHCAACGIDLIDRVTRDNAVTGIAFHWGERHSTLVGPTHRKDGTWTAECGESMCSFGGYGRSSKGAVRSLVRHDLTAHRGLS